MHRQYQQTTHGYKIFIGNDIANIEEADVFEDLDVLLFNTYY